MIRAKCLFLLLAVFACKDSGPEPFDLPTSVCVRTLHHSQPIPQATVFVKFNSDTFPGYDQPAAFFDASFRTGADARGCLAPLPEGRHWLVALGYDSLYFPHELRGSLRVEISLGEQPKVDTTLYVSE